MLDLLGSVLEANHAISHLKRWMKPSRRSTELLFLGNSVKVTYQPKGVVGVIVPWNFPIYLAMGPLVTALAAGNRVMIKMSEVTPATNAVFKTLLGEVFGEDLVAVVGEELVDPNVFTSLPFDHIVFTGSPAVGKIVMRTAAQNLTPVTLELGGKSPAVVTRHYPLADAALRITHGKSVNCGQICIAPDYALVPRESVDEFVAVGQGAASSSSTARRTEGNPNFTSVVSDRQLQRMRGGAGRRARQGRHRHRLRAATVGAGNRQLPLHIVTGATPDMAVLKEELFGPVLPVVPYDTAGRRHRLHQCAAAPAGAVLLQPRRCRARRAAAAHAFGRRLAQRLGLARDQPRRAFRRHRQLGHRQLPRRRGLSRAVARAHRVPAPALVPDAAVPSALRQLRAAPVDEVLPRRSRPVARRQVQALTSLAAGERDARTVGHRPGDVHARNARAPFNIGPLVLLRPPAGFKGNFADKLHARLLKRPPGPPFNYRLKLSLTHAPSVEPMADPDIRGARAPADAAGRVDGASCWRRSARCTRRCSTAQGCCGSSTSSTAWPTARVALYGKVHHGIIDGRTFVKAVTQWMSEDPKDKDGARHVGRRGTLGARAPASAPASCSGWSRPARRRRAWCVPPPACTACSPSRGCARPAWARACRCPS